MSSGWHASSAKLVLVLIACQSHVTRSDATGGASGVESRPTSPCRHASQPMRLENRVRVTTPSACASGDLRVIALSARARALASGLLHHVAQGLLVQTQSEVDPERCRASTPNPQKLQFM